MTCYSDNNRPYWRIIGIGTKVENTLSELKI